MYGDGSQAYDFIYVSDVARANICAMKAAASDKNYNVGSGVQTSILELTNLILNITGSDQKIQYEPAGKTFVTNRIGDPHLATEELGFTYTIELEEGLRKLIEWRSAHKELVEQRRKRA